LNGIKIPRILRLKTLFAKLFGVVSAVAGGLVIGQESVYFHFDCLFFSLYHSQ
jgi:chloride channel 7